MPYTLVGNCVHKKNSDGSAGEKVKCHESKAKAQAHLRALQANVEDAMMDKETTDEKMFTRPTQEQVNYVTLSPDMPTRACANCMWFIPNGEYGAQCHIISNYPEDVLATGVCDRWEAPLAPEQPETVVIEVQADSVEIMTGEMEISAPIEPVEVIQPENRTGTALSRLKETLTKLLPTPQASVDPETGSGFKVYDTNGKTYWVAWWSNDFKDRENEIISRAAHDRYLARVDKGLTPMPELWFWHIKGTAHGQAEWLGRVDHMMVAVGTFKDDARSQKFVAHYRKGKTRYGVSHGFNYPTWALQNGVYADYNTFEISPLPRQAAANLYTGFDEVKTMTITEAKRAALAKIVGEDGVDDILNDTEAFSKELEKLGLSFKDFSDIPAAEAAAKEKDGAPLMGKLFLSMIAAQGDLVSKQDTIEKQLADLLEAHKTQLDALKGENANLTKQVNELKEAGKLAPRASQADSTVTDDEKLKEEMQLKVADNDQFWGDLNVPVETIS